MFFKKKKNEKQINRNRLLFDVYVALFAGERTQNLKAIKRQTLFLDVL